MNTETMDKNVICPYCKKEITAPEIEKRRCKKCKVSLAVIPIKTKDKVGFLLDERLSQFKFNIL